MESSGNVDNLCEGIKELFSKNNQDLRIRPDTNDLHSEEIDGTLANKVKAVIEEALSHDIEEEISRISDFDLSNVDTIVNNITKTIINSPQMLCLEENINNIIETCTQELITEYPSHNLSNLNPLDNMSNLNDHYNNDDTSKEKLRSNSVTPILHSYQYIEIAHNITSHKPLFIRMQAFEVLLSSQLTDAITSPNWSVLQKSLQNVLSDDHYDIFHLCLKVHSKLITSTSPEGIKESFLNILESLCQHYYMHKLECNEINIKVSAHYRMIRLTNLMLDCIKEMAQALPRFGEKRLIEMIDNFMHLISIHSTSQAVHADTSTDGFNVLDIVSCLDPKANWFMNLSYSAVSRKIMFLKMAQNLCLLRIIVNEIIEWFNNPIFAEDDMLSGNVTKQSCKFAKFIHCLSLVSKICTFETGRNLFPIVLNKNEEPIKIQKITIMVLRFLNKQQLIEEKLEVIFSDFFIKFLINSVEDLMSLKDTSNYSLLNLLHLLFEPLSEKPELPPQHTVAIITSLCDRPDGPHSYFFKYGLNSNKRRNLLINMDNNSFSEHSVSPNSAMTNTGIVNQTDLVNDIRQDNMKELKINNIEKQILTMKSTIDSFTYYSFCPVKIISNVLVTLLKTKKLRDMTVTAKLVNVCSKLFQLHEGITILESNKSQVIHYAAIVYQELIDIIKADGYKILEERNFYVLFSSIENFIIVTGTTPLGFYLIQKEQRMVSDCFLQKLQQPKISWADPKWRLFMTFVSFNKDCAGVIANESKYIFKEVLINLWSVMEDSFVTDSSIQLDEAINHLMVCVSSLSLSLNATRAIFGSVSSAGAGDCDEIDSQSDQTVTEHTIESYPETIVSLITKYGLANDTFYYKAHEIGLNVLNLFVSTNMDNILYLLHKFQFQEKLLQLQLENRVNETCNLSASSTTNGIYNHEISVDNIIIDECSIMRHEILEKTYSLGPYSGNEKMYSDSPSLQSTQLKMKTKPRVYIELNKFLQETKNGLHDINWLKQARKSYRTGGNDELKCTLLVDLVERVQWALGSAASSESGDGIKWPPMELSESMKLFPEDYIGIQMTIRYGVQHRLLQMQSTVQSTENLTKVLKWTRLSLFGVQPHPEKFGGFDWFLATIYLVCSGNVEKCQSMLTSLSTLPCIAFIWDQYAISVGFSTAVFGHVLEMLVKCEVPLAFYALTNNGISWWLVCRQWIRECFWRMLDWNQMCHWLTFSMLHQPDYIIYLCVSILHHIGPRVLDDSTSGTLWKLVTCPLEKYVIVEHLPYMDKLWRRHHSTVQPYLDSCP